MRRKIIAIVDYRGMLYSSTRVSTSGMDIDLISTRLAEYNIVLEEHDFSDRLFQMDWNGVYVIYQSSEDRNLYYKSYISDVIFRLRELGAVLIPSYDYFYCHENKVYQSLLLMDKPIKGVEIPSFSTHGTFEDLKMNAQNICYPIVLKRPDGCQSKGVTLVSNPTELLIKGWYYTRSYDLKDWLRYLAKTVLKKGYIRESSNRKKVLLQEFIPNLSGDYKVLVYGKKIFALKRSAKSNDFRASGSGLFSFPKDIPPAVLDAAQAVFDYFKCPFLSLDLAHCKDTDKVYLIEYQFMMFGTYTLESSPHYFVLEDGSWQAVESKSSLEIEFSDSLIAFIKKHYE